MPSWFHLGVKIWPKPLQDASKSAQGADQEPPEKRPRGILEPTWAQMASRVRANLHHGITSYFNVSLKLSSKRFWTKCICESNIQLNKIFAKHILCLRSRNMKNRAQMHQKWMQNRFQVIVNYRVRFASDDHPMCGPNLCVKDRSIANTAARARFPIYCFFKI